MIKQDTLMLSFQTMFESNVKELKRFLETDEAKNNNNLREIAEMWLKETQEIIVPCNEYFEVAKKRFGRARKKKQVFRIIWKAEKMKKKMKQKDIDAFKRINEIIGDN